MAGNPDFDLFQLPEEHDELRAAIRALAEKEIAPHAADVDENERFPQEALDALNAAGFNAVHVPEAVRRSGCRFGRDLHRDRGGRAGVRVVVAHPRRQQARHDGPDPQRLR